MNDDNVTETRSLEEQIEGIETLLVSLHERLDQAAAVRHGWLNFSKVILAHSLVTYLAIVLLDQVGDELLSLAAYGWLAGSIASLGIWHGTSLRPAGERWLRTSVSILAVALIFFITNTTSSLYDFTVFCGTWIVYAGGACIFAARLVRGIYMFGIAAPDGPSIRPQPLSIASILIFVTWIALLVAISQIPSEAISQPEVLLPISLYGAGVGGLFGVSLILWKRRSKVYQRILIVCELGLALCLFSGAMFQIAVFMESGDTTQVLSWSFLSKAIPGLTAYTLVLLISPLLTFWFLARNGHILLVGEGHAKPTRHSRETSDTVEKNDTVTFDQLD